MSKSKVLFINTEVMPYLPESRMAKIGRQLPQGIQEAGHEIRTFMPRFGVINERRNQLHEVIRLSGMNLIINETDHPLIIKVASIQAARMQVYFIDNDDYFTHRELFADRRGSEYEDNGERAYFFARGVAETIRKLHWTPDVIYCQGWFASFAPLLIKKHYGDDPCFRNCKIVTALYSNNFEKPLSANLAQTIKCEGITKNDLAEVREKQVTHTMLCRLGIKFSDGVIVTDAGIAPELVDYANEQGKKVLMAADEELDIEKYDTFFNEIAAADEAAKQEV
ncbi:MAG: glycogen/starch synthase [Bacteroidales bacterium]|jgi:starch synthase|nr:glycogen synthase [Bacteroidales bacterium]MCR5362203.1 glycogen/starch synthase [Bacteroidales bacterium]